MTLRPAAALALSWPVILLSPALAQPRVPDARGLSGVLREEPPGRARAAPPAGAPSRPQRLQQARRWVYQLQGLDPAAAAKVGWEVLVTDPSRDGDDERWWPRDVVEGLQRRGGLVLAYLSIGEAEDYRGYWRAEWKRRPPAWLGPENPEWRGNYKVRYWAPEWQQVLLGPGGPLERILERGYDGVYLDIIDAWEFWSERGELTADAAQERMVAFVQEIARRARARTPDFLVVPQNAPEVAVRPAMLETISGLALEDTFFWDDEPREPEETRRVLELAGRVRAAGKPVLAVDYCRRPENVRRFYQLAAQAGLVPYATVRDLDRLVAPPR